VAIFDGNFGVARRPAKMATENGIGRKPPENGGDFEEVSCHFRLPFCAAGAAEAEERPQAPTEG